mgnify:CR=1 FL=1
MTNTIRIDLDTVRVYRNKSEYRTTQRARSSLGHEVIGDGPIISELASILRAENPQFDGPLEVYRGDTRCFGPMPLKTAFLKGSQPKQFRRQAA